jgi:hypothetical protein
VTAAVIVADQRRLEEYRRLNQTFHVCGFVVIGALLLTLPDLALANWWIVRASDKQCLVVDIEPRGKDKSVTKIGKTVYPTREEAEADVKRLCK